MRPTDTASWRPTWIEVDLEAVRENARTISRVAGAPLFAVVKADAYGHGAVAVARALEGEPVVRGFAVSLVEEGVELRDAGVTAPILVMGPALERAHDELVHADLTPLLSTEHDLELFHQAAARRGVRADAHLKIDTGMGRVGFSPEGAQALIDRVLALPHLELAGVATHFACADTDDPGDDASMTRAQMTAFERVLAGLPGPGIVRHMANSSAALWFPGAGLDAARPGLALYGNGRPPPAGHALPAGHAPLRQAMRLCTRVAQVRTLEPGAAVSYGALWRARRRSRVAVLPVGYADGVPRRVTGSAEVLIHGVRVPVIGAVTMDMTMIDVTDLGERVAPGDLVAVLGSQGDARISTREFAEWAGVIEYEVTCGMSKRVPRLYTGQRP